MKIKTSFLRVISLLLIPCLLVGCYAYKRVDLPKDGVLPVEAKIVVLQSGSDRFCLYEAEITGSHIRGTLRPLDSVPSVPKKLELRIYVSPAFEIPASLPAAASVPFTAIERAEVYDVSVGKTVFYWVGIPAIAVGVFLVVLFAVAVASGSCPFIYAFDGTSYEFEGEIYPGAIFPPLERHDYLPLPNLKATDGEYRIKLANELREIQNTNLTELLVIDHPPSAEVLVDKYGVPHTLTEPQSPAEAVTLKGEDVTAVVAAADDAPYVGDLPEKVDGKPDGLILTFRRPPGTSVAKLVVEGKNSLWLEYVLDEFCELFGDTYDDWYEKKGQEPPEKFRRWLLEQRIPLAVYVDDAGEWRFVDYFHVAGPMSAKRCVLPLELPGPSDEVRVKLEYGPLFWELDYVALDFSADLPLQVRGVSPASAVDEAGRDVSERLRADDGQYYVQAEVGECAFLTFAAPAPAEGMARATFLHSKGHYEIPRGPQGKPNRGLLYSFKKPGKFVEFSQELFMKRYREMVASEY